MIKEQQPQTRLDHAIEQVQKQQENRPQWNAETDAEFLAKFIVEEAQELVKAVMESFVTGDVFTVASELGDLLYLVHRACNELGFDPADLIEMKSVRNSMKYPDYILNNGYNRAEAVKLSKAMWEEMGSDQVFSHAYLELFSK